MITSSTDVVNFDYALLKLILSFTKSIKEINHQNLKPKITQKMTPSLGKVSIANTIAFEWVMVL